LSTEPRIRLIVADAHEVVICGLRSLLAEHHEFDCIGSAANGREAIDLAIQLHPDVLIMSIAMPLCDGLEATRRLRKLSLATNVLIFTMRTGSSVTLAFLRAGARGFVSKSSPNSVLIDAIPIVAAGRRFIDPNLKDEVLRLCLDETTIAARETLTKREREVLLEVAWGFTNISIGAHLGVSTKTVEGYRARACDKLELIDRPAIVKFALLSGWMEQARENPPPVCKLAV
jgi:two-component system, NarL family, response regulator NreC